MNQEVKETIEEALDYKAKIMKKTVERLRDMVSRAEDMNGDLCTENMKLRVGMKNLRYKMLGMIHDEDIHQTDCQKIADALFNLLYPKSREKGG